MEPKLQGKKVAILVTDGFEQVELTEPRQALIDAGAQTVLIAPRKEDVRAWDHTNWGDSFAVDMPLELADPLEFDALMLPGGVMNPDALRQIPEAVAFIEHFFENAKPVAAICHAPALLIEADVVEGRRLTSYPSLRTDLYNAGAEWVDEEVVVDNGLVTSRRPDDLPAFNEKMIEEIAEGQHAPSY